MDKGAGWGLRSLALWGVAAALLACSVAPGLPAVLPTETPAPLATTDVCVEYCQREGFSAGRCACSSCYYEETYLESVRLLTDEEFAAIQDGCGSLPDAEPALPCVWVCCCQ